jgi:GT2 family glycosyltransferase
LNGISVVVATHGREALVLRLLHSLVITRQRIELPSEVIVVDSSIPEVSKVIADGCVANRVEYVFEAANNVRRKRNIGIKQAKYSIILFIDSDCEATMNLLSEHAQCYSRDGSIGGVVGVTRFAGPRSSLWRVVERTSLLDAFTYAERHASVPWGPTCNISYRRDVLDVVGLFDESFPFRLGGDDTDLGLRVTDAGYRIICNPQAVVEHAPETWDGVPLIVRRVFRWGRMHFHLIRKHPHRVYFDFPKLSAIFVLLIVGLTVMAFTLKQPTLAFVPWLWMLLELTIETAAVTLILTDKWTAFGQVFGARLFSFLFEAGTLTEALKQRSLLPVFKEISYTPPSLAGRYRRVAQTWGICLSLTILMLIMMSF